MKKTIALLLLLALFLIACNQNSQNSEKKSTEIKTDTTSKINKEAKDDSISDQDILPEFSDTSLADIELFSKDFILEMVYASKDNFFEKKFYNCPKCYLRYEAILALLKASEDFRKLGFKIKLFDCFRPFAVQEEMWKTLPDRRYVANPQTGGSIHNKGAAVDLSLTNLNDVNLNMGTKFDHFGPESAHSYTKIDSTCISNRKTLKEIMEKNGFKALETEWWHYTFVSEHKYTNANFQFNCN